MKCNLKCFGKLENELINLDMESVRKAKKIGQQLVENKYAIRYKVTKYKKIVA